MARISQQTLRFRLTNKSCQLCSDPAQPSPVFVEMWEDTANPCGRRGRYRACARPAPSKGPGSSRQGTQRGGGVGGGSQKLSRMADEHKFTCVPKRGVGQSPSRPWNEISWIVEPGSNLTQIRSHPGIVWNSRRENQSLESPKFDGPRVVPFAWGFP